ncbi:MAG TPA: glycosyltransferase family 9 protein, partial [Bryobacteraceae bacterium]|nr:glycosyltransferase family 9 protein [Bryobacteraceae bacterium]
YWSELARRLESCGCALVMNGRAPANIEGTVSHVSGLAGLIWATRKARAVVGLDSGPLHLAGALSKPGVAIFGPTDPARNGPPGTSIVVLRSPDAVTSYRRTGDVSNAMRAITPDHVWDALQPALQNSAAT